MIPATYFGRDGLSALPGKRPSARRLSWLPASLIVLSACVAGEAGAATRGVAGAASSPPPFEYTVQPGDTLSQVAERLTTSPANWRALQRLNNVASPQRLMPGTRLLIPHRLLKGESDVAVVIRGDENSFVDGKPLKVGDTVRENAVVETSDQSVVVLRLSDGSTLRLEPASKLRLERLRRYHDDRAVEARALLERGRIQTSATPNRPRPMSVRTPVATAAVRGTVFRVASEADHATAEVLEGGVDWQVPRRDRTKGKPNQVRLMPGYGSRVDSNVPSEPEALLPATDLSSLPALTRLTHQTLSFAPVDGAVGYRVEISRDNRADGRAQLSAAAPAGVRPPGRDVSLADSLNQQDLSLVLARVVTEPRVELASLADGIHYIDVRPIARSSLEGLQARAAVNVQARPLPPTGARPVPDAVVFGDRINFEWSKPVNINRFRVELAADPLFAKPLASQTVDGPRVSLALKADGREPLRHYWRVASIEPNGHTGPYAEHQFVWHPGPSQPSLTPGGHDRMSLKWAGVTGHRYRVQVADNEAFENPREFVVDRPKVVVDQLKPGRYFMRLQSIAPNGESSPFNVPQTFEIKPVVLTGDGTPIRTGSGLDLESPSTAGPN